MLRGVDADGGGDCDLVVPIVFDEGSYFCALSIAGGRTLLALADTGSPFMVVNGDLYDGQGVHSAYADTYERYTSEEVSQAHLRRAVSSQPV